MNTSSNLSVADSSNGSTGLGMFQSKEQILQMNSSSNLESVDDSDPHASNVTHPTSYLDTMLHIFRGNIGSGLLAMGDAFKNGGLVFATISTALLGIICVHAQHLLLNCSEDLYRSMKRDKPPGFAETVYLVFKHGPVRLRGLAKAMKITINTFLCVTQLGFCCIYIVFIANNMKMIFDNYNIYIDLSIHMIFVVIPILVMSMVRNLKYLTPFSTLANLMMAVGVGVVIYVTAQNLPPISDRDFIGVWQQLPLYFGTAIYAFEGIGLVLPLKNEMRHPDQFQKPLGVLNVTMTFVGIIMIMVGFLGYLKYGNGVQGSLTLNMENGQVLSIVVQTLIALGILLTYPLQLYVPIKVTWPSLRKKLGPKAHVTKELGYRALLVLLTYPSNYNEAIEVAKVAVERQPKSLYLLMTLCRVIRTIPIFILAESIPELGLFISLVGAVSSTALALIFPPIIDMVLNVQKPGGLSIFVICKDVTIMLLGVFIFITGTYESVASIIKAFIG